MKGATEMVFVQTTEREREREREKERERDRRRKYVRKSEREEERQRFTNLQDWSICEWREGGSRRGS